MTTPNTTIALSNVNSELGLSSNSAITNFKEGNYYNR